MSNNLEEGKKSSEISICKSEKNPTSISAYISTSEKLEKNWLDFFKKRVNSAKNRVVGISKTFLSFFFIAKFSIFR